VPLADQLPDPREEAHAVGNDVEPDQPLESAGIDNVRGPVPVVADHEHRMRPLRRGGGRCEGQREDDDREQARRSPGEGDIRGLPRLATHYGR
jgi:hypothetical protein